MKGDSVEVVIDSGEGGTMTYELTATRQAAASRSPTTRGIIEVSEVTRTGTAVRTARFMASRVVALSTRRTLRARTSIVRLALPMDLLNTKTRDSVRYLTMRSPSCRGVLCTPARRPNYGWARIRPRRPASAACHPPHPHPPTPQPLQPHSPL